MKQLGQYAKDKNNNLHQFELTKDDKLFIITPLGKVESNHNDYDIVDIGEFSVTSPVLITPKVRKFEIIDTNIEINEDFLPNSKLTYQIEFDGVDKFKATLETSNFDHKLFGVKDAPKTLHYKLTEPLSEFTEDEKENILNYRGLNLKDDNFTPSDIFMEKTYIVLIGVDVEISTSVKQTIKFDEGESSEEFKERTTDIYLHSSGENGHQYKTDLGGNTSIKFI